MKQNRTLMVVALVLVCILTLAACGGSSSQTDNTSAGGTASSGSDSSSSGGSDEGPIRLGLECPMTGTNASFGEQLSTGAQLAVDQINADGGVNGRMIELDIQDDKSDPKEAATIVTKWAADPTIVGTFGYYNSSCGLAALPIVNQNNLPTIVTGSTPSISEQNKTYGFRLEPSDLQQATMAANWMVNDGCKNIAILYESTDYGIGQREIASQTIKDIGGSVAVEEAYILGETKDFTNILTKVKNSGADSIFLAGVYNEGALIVKQMKQLNIDIPAYSSSSMFEQAFLDLAGEAANGVRVQGVLVPTDPDPIVSAFQEAYQSKFGEGKLGGTFTSYGYDSVRLYAEAIAAVGTDPDAIVDYFENVQFEGTSGIISFDQNHDIIREQLTQLIVENGEFVIYNR